MAERSTIKFPYGDLDDAVDVAQRLHSNYGRSCSLDQLAAALGQTISGAFRQKVATASTFGVIQSLRRQVVLTDLGARLVDPRTEQAARADAFLAVPLYKRVFETYQGGRLPEDAGLERELVRMGVSEKVAAKARQALQRSAEQAGFFRAGRDRLVKPAAGTIGDVGATTVQEQAAETKPPEPEAPAKHPLLVGLWEMLPGPREGMSTDEQAEWLEAAKVNLRLVYGKGRSSVPSVSERPSEQPPNAAQE
jgi:hypothetical protein